MPGRTSNETSFTATTLPNHFETVSTVITGSATGCVISRPAGSGSTRAAGASVDDDEVPRDLDRRGQGLPGLHAGGRLASEDQVVDVERHVRQAEERHPAGRAGGDDVGDAADDRCTDDEGADHERCAVGAPVRVRGDERRDRRVVEGDRGTGEQEARHVQPVVAEVRAGVGRSEHEPRQQDESAAARRPRRMTVRSADQRATRSRSPSADERDTG